MLCLSCCYLITLLHYYILWIDERTVEVVTFYVRMLSNQIIWWFTRIHVRDASNKMQCLNPFCSIERQQPLPTNTRKCVSVSECILPKRGKLFSLSLSFLPQSEANTIKLTALVLYLQIYTCTSFCEFFRFKHENFLDDCCMHCAVIIYCVDISCVFVMHMHSMQKHL